MRPVLLAIAAAAGAHLLHTSLVGPPRRVAALARPRRPAQRWAAVAIRAGLADVRPEEVAAAVAASGVIGGLAAFAVFGGVLPALVVAGFAASLPIASYRGRRRALRAAAMEAWPRMLEELRLLTSSLGRSIPQAVVEVGRHAPDELRPAFAAAEREWYLSTDFSRMLGTLKRSLADPTADAACETLLVAHEVGGADLDHRLEALIDDRLLDAQGRKDARARQAGARFARRFVLVVPAGMAFAGMSVGTGRAAYQTPTGQALVVVAIGMVIACWVWAGRIMTIPEDERVFDA